MRILASLLILLLSSTVSAEIFKTVDKNGNVIFTDQGNSNAEKIKLEEPTSYTPQEYEREATFGASEEQKPEMTYDSLAITSPENDATIRDNAGNIIVGYNISPKPHPDHKVELIVDGQAHSTVSGAGTVSLANVDRGTHQFSIRVTNRSTGKEVQTGAPVVIHLHRASIAR